MISTQHAPERPDDRVQPPTIPLCCQRDTTGSCEIVAFVTSDELPFYAAARDLTALQQQAQQGAVFILHLDCLIGGVSAGIRRRNSSSHR